MTKKNKKKWCWCYPTSLRKPPIPYSRMTPTKAEKEKKIREKHRGKGEEQ